MLGYLPAGREDTLALLDRARELPGDIEASSVFEEALKLLGLLGIENENHDDSCSSCFARALGTGIWDGGGVTTDSETDFVDVSSEKKARNFVTSGSDSDGIL